MTDLTSPSAFRQEAIEFLASAAQKRVVETFKWGVGSDVVAVMSVDGDDESSVKRMQELRQWKASEFDAGFGWISGPTQYGGRGMPVELEQEYRELKSQYDTPPETELIVGLGMVAPTILAHATERVKQLYLRGLWRGDIIGCQLFSEPDAGSDLASMKTRATRDGDGWRVTGQKVWTSGAHHSDIGEIIARTDESAPKHRGLSAFVIDMHAPGVEPRPLRQMNGGASFNEVFLDNVWVRDDHRLGTVNEGWGVALTTLMNERSAIGSVATDDTWDRILGLARWLGMTQDQGVRQEMASLFIHEEVARMTNLRWQNAQENGAVPGPIMSIGKLQRTDNLQRRSDIVSRLLGPRMIADTGEWGTFSWSGLVLEVPGMRIAGGTDEVMRNILGERVLGLPK